MDNLEYKLFYRRGLPHIQPPGATLFITFRLAGTIPTQALQNLIAEAEATKAALSQVADANERNQRTDVEQRRLFGKWDAILDTARDGPFWLRDPRVAELVCESMRHRDGRAYDLDAFCVMPNHVHLICTPRPKAEGSYFSMSSIMHSLKSYTAHKANRLLEREGGFWQRESYDHVVRDEDEWRRVVTYVLQNPVKAGLVEQWQEWKWTYCRDLQ